MKVTANRAEQCFQPIELKIVIETQEEFDMWYNAADQGELDSLLDSNTSWSIYDTLKQFKYQ